MFLLLSRDDSIQSGMLGPVIIKPIIIKGKCVLKYLLFNFKILIYFRNCFSGLRFIDLSISGV